MSEIGLVRNKLVLSILIMYTAVEQTIRKQTFFSEWGWHLIWNFVAVTVTRKSCWLLLKMLHLYWPNSERHCRRRCILSELKVSTFKLCMQIQSKIAVGMNLEVMKQCLTSCTHCLLYACVWPNGLNYDVTALWECLLHLTSRQTQSQSHKSGKRAQYLLLRKKS